MCACDCVCVCTGFFPAPQFTGLTVTTDAYIHSAFYLWDIFCLIDEVLRVSFVICHSIFIVM